MPPLIAAYGRRYLTEDAIRKDLREGKDFKDTSVVRSGTYCSTRDFSGPIEVRYGANNEHLIMFDCGE